MAGVPSKRTAESAGPSQPAGGGEPRRSFLAGLARLWRRMRIHARALGLLSAASTCIAASGVVGGRVGALAAGVLVLCAGALLLVSVPVTAFSRNQATLVKKALEFATTVADVCLIMDRHAAAFNVIFRRPPAPGPTSQDMRTIAASGSGHASQPFPAGQADPIPGPGQRHLTPAADRTPAAQAADPIPASPTADPTSAPEAADRNLAPQADGRGGRHPALTFWQLLTLGERQALSAAARSVRFTPGTYICRQGERADHVLIIESGWTRVFTEHADGIKVIAERGPGDLVGERAVMMVRRRSATVIALEDVQALLVPDEGFARFLHAYPRVNALLENQVYQRLTEDRSNADLSTPAASWTGQICPILLTDIAAFGSPSRNDADRLRLRQLMYGLLPEAFETVGLSWRDCYREDRGDGTLIVIPPHIPAAMLLEHALGHLAATLREHNERTAGALRMQLRVALHAGPVTRDDEGMAGHAINHTARLVQAKALSRQLRETQADLGVIASEFFFEHVIQQHGSQPPVAAGYQKIRFQSKDSMLTAWVHLAGSRADCALAELRRHSALALRADPRRVRSSQQVTGRGAGGDRGKRDRQRVVGLGVPDQRGAEQRADQHGNHRDQAAARLGPGAAGQRAVGGDARDGQGEHGGGQIGDRDGAGCGVLDPHADAQGRDEGVPVASRQRAAADDGEDDRGREEGGLGCGGGGVQPGPVGAMAGTEPAAEQRPDSKEGHGGQGRGDRESGRTGQGEAEEHHVPGHVGDEDVPEDQVAERVDQAGDQRHADQQRRQRAVPVGAARHEHIAGIGQERRHQVTVMPLVRRGLRGRRGRRGRRGAHRSSVLRRPGGPLRLSAKTPSVDSGIIFCSLVLCL
jgi:CRP-like cAMP-binding protein